MVFKVANYVTRQNAGSVRLTQVAVYNTAYALDLANLAASAPQIQVVSQNVSYPQGSNYPAQLGYINRTMANFFRRYPSLAACAGMVSERAPLPENWVNNLITAVDKKRSRMFTFGSKINAGQAVMLLAHVSDPELVTAILGKRGVSYKAYAFDRTQLTTISHLIGTNPYIYPTLQANLPLLMKVANSCDGSGMLNLLIASQGEQRVRLEQVFIHRLFNRQIELSDANILGLISWVEQNEHSRLRDSFYSFAAWEQRMLQVCAEECRRLMASEDRGADTRAQAERLIAMISAMPAMMNDYSRYRDVSLFIKLRIGDTALVNFARLAARFNIENVSLREAASVYEVRVAAKDLVTRARELDAIVQKALFVATRKLRNRDLEARVRATGEPSASDSLRQQSGERNMEARRQRNEERLAVRREVIAAVRAKNPIWAAELERMLEVSIAARNDAREARSLAHGAPRLAQKARRSRSLGRILDAEVGNDLTGYFNYLRKDLRRKQHLYLAIVSSMRDDLKLWKGEAEESVSDAPLLALDVFENNSETGNIDFVAVLREVGLEDLADLWVNLNATRSDLLAESILNLERRALLDYCEKLYAIGDKILRSCRGRAVLEEPVRADDARLRSLEQLLRVANLDLQNPINLVDVKPALSRRYTAGLYYIEPEEVIIDLDDGDDTDAESAEHSRKLEAIERARIPVPVKYAVVEQLPLALSEEEAAASDILARYPERREVPADQEVVLTYGDLHANALLLIRLLIQSGVLNISEADYMRLYLIYTKLDLSRENRNPLSPERMAELVVEFCQIVEQAGFAIPPQLVHLRLIGDELADRGANDWLMLKILQKLTTSQAKVDVLFSNHGEIFTNAVKQSALLTRRDKHVSVPVPYGELRHRIDTDYAPSQVRAVIKEGMAVPEEKLLAFTMQSKSLVQMGILSSNAEARRILQRAGMDITPAAMYDFMRTNYLPHVKLIDYRINGENITLYTHAPICYRVVRAAARKFVVEYRDGTIQELAATIDAINTEFQRRFMAGTLEINRRSTDPIESPVHHILWSRGRDAHADSWDEGLPEALDGHVNYVHGHDGGGFEIRPDAQNLDDNFGKTHFDPERRAYAPIRSEHGGHRALVNGSFPLVTEYVAMRPEISLTPTSAAEEQRAIEFAKGFLVRYLEALDRADAVMALQRFQGDLRRLENKYAAHTAGRGAALTAEEAEKLRSYRQVRNVANRIFLTVLHPETRDVIVISEFERLADMVESVVDQGLDDEYSAEAIIDGHKTYHNGALDKWREQSSSYMNLVIFDQMTTDLSRRRQAGTLSGFGMEILAQVAPRWNVIRRRFGQLHDLSRRNKDVDRVKRDLDSEIESVIKDGIVPLARRDWQVLPGADIDIDLLAVGTREFSSHQREFRYAPDQSFDFNWFNAVLNNVNSIDVARLDDNQLRIKLFFNYMHKLMQPHLVSIGRAHVEQGRDRNSMKAVADLLRNCGRLAYTQQEALANIALLAQEPASSSSAVLDGLGGEMDEFHAMRADEFEQLLGDGSATPVTPAQTGIPPAIRSGGLTAEERAQITRGSVDEEELPPPRMGRV